jgi:hypothetical protein
MLRHSGLVDETSDVPAETLNNANYCMQYTLAKLIPFNVIHFAR